MAFFKLSSFKNPLIIQERFLTQGEKALVTQVFGDHLRVDQIRIVAHRMVLKDYAVSPNGSVYFNAKDWCADFSVRGLNEQSWLIHELTHVWQIQQGLAVIRKALVDRRYQYVLEAGKNFFDYGIEQQAQMVQDYFVKLKKGQDCSAYQECIPFISKV